MKIGEYLLLDPMGMFLDQPLLLKRLQHNGRWKDIVDPDGGITSRLGFRVVMREDGLYVVDANTGIDYVRPDDAQAVVEAAQERIRQLEAELARKKRRKKSP